MGEVSIEDLSMGQLIRGDALKELKVFPNNLIPLVCTDPPYNIGKQCGPRAEKKGKSLFAWDDNQDPTTYWNWFKNVFAEIYRVMTDGYLYVSHSDKGVWTAKPILETIGFNYIQSLVWWGKNGYNLRLARHCWSYRHEIILFMKKGVPGPLICDEKGMWFTSVIEASRPQSNYKEGRYHPTQKPVKLYKTLIQRTPGRVVLDPFMGSGTTALACQALGRKFIGIELYPKYCRIIKKRLEQSATIERTVNDD